MRLLPLLFAAALASCTFLTSFDPDGQPCDKTEPNPALSCLSDAGYWCVAGFCRKGGADGGSDGGNLGG